MSWNKMNYTQSLALKQITDNCEVKHISRLFFIVKNGTAGNKTLGAVDYLNKHTNIQVSIVTEKQFKSA